MFFLSFLGKGPNGLSHWEKPQLSITLYHNITTVVTWT